MADNSKQIKTWQIFLTLAIFVVTIVFQTGVVFSRFSQVEDRVKVLEQGREQNRQNIEKSCSDIAEIKINLKFFMEKMGIKYTEK